MISVLFVMHEVSSVCVLYSGIVCFAMHMLNVSVKCADSAMCSAVFYIVHIFVMFVLETCSSISRVAAL